MIRDKRAQRIVKAVESWIRSEYEFRHGPQAYSDTTQHWMVKAEDRLRRRLTGEADLLKAYKSIQGHKDGCSD